MADEFMTINCASLILPYESHENKMQMKIIKHKWNYTSNPNL